MRAGVSPSFAPRADGGAFLADDVRVWRGEPDGGCGF
jgi:hypothetical protein